MEVQIWAEIKGLQLVHISPAATVSNCCLKGCKRHQNYHWLQIVPTQRRDQRVERELGIEKSVDRDLEVQEHTPAHNPSTEVAIG